MEGSDTPVTGRHLVVTTGEGDSNPAAWRLVESADLVRDTWLHLRSDHCIRNDGIVLNPYYVLQYADWVSILPITLQDTVVLVEEYRHAAGVIGMGLPGGGLDESDMSPSDAARRELLEETGYVCDELVSVGWTYANWASHTNRVHHFVALGCVLVARQDPDPTEQIRVTEAELTEALDPHFLKQSYHLATIALARDVLKSRGILAPN